MAVYSGNLISLILNTQTSVICGGIIPILGTANRQFNMLQLQTKPLCNGNSEGRIIHKLYLIHLTCDVKNFKGFHI